MRTIAEKEEDKEEGEKRRKGSFNSVFPWFLLFRFSGKQSNWCMNCHLGKVEAQKTVFQLLPNQ